MALQRKERFYHMCKKQVEIQDEIHHLLYCEYFTEQRNVMDKCLEKFVERWR